MTNDEESRKAIVDEFVKQVGLSKVVTANISKLGIPPGQAIHYTRAETQSRILTTF